MLLEGNNGSDFVILSLDGGEHLLEPLGVAPHLVLWAPEDNSNYFLQDPEDPESFVVSLDGGELPLASIALAVHPVVGGAHGPHAVLQVPLVVHLRLL